VGKIRMEVSVKVPDADHEVGGLCRKVGVMKFELYRGWLWFATVNRIVFFSFLPQHISMKHFRRVRLYLLRSPVAGGVGLGAADLGADGRGFLSPILAFYASLAYPQNTISCYATVWCAVFTVNKLNW